MAVATNTPADQAAEKKPVGNTTFLRVTRYISTRIVTLVITVIIGVYLSVRFPLSIFGAVVNGFQRYYLNNAVSIGTSLLVAGVNVGVLSAGYGLVALVAATTLVRVSSLGLFVWNA